MTSVPAPADIATAPEEAAPVLPSTVLGAPHEFNGKRVVAEGLKEEVGRAVERTGYLGDSPELRDALARQITAQAAAGSVVPLDAKRSLTDRWAIEAALHLSKALDRARRKARRLMREVIAAQTKLADLARPWSHIKRFSFMVALALMAVLGALVMGLLQAPSIDEFLLKDYIASPAGATLRAIGLTSGLLAFVLATLFGLFLLGLPTVAVVYGGKRLPRLVKVAVVAAGVLTSIGFSIMRLEDELTFAGLAVAFYELAPLITHAAVLHALAVVLEADTERREVYERERQGVAVTMAACQRAETALRELDQRLSAQVEALERREQETRMLPMYQEALAATVDAEYQVAVAELIAKNVQTIGTDEALACMVDDHLAQTYQRLATITPARRASL